MLHYVESILPEPSIVAIVDRKCTVTDDRLEQSAETIDVKAIGRDRLPREFATGAETTHVAFEAEFFALRNLMPDPRAHHGIHPFEAARPGDRRAARTLKLQARSGKSTVSVPVSHIERSTSSFQYRALPMRSKAVMLPDPLCQRATSYATPD